MSPRATIVLGSPTREEAAAVLAAVQVILDSEAAPEPEAPWAYRSAWRRTAIEEALDGWDGWDVP